MRTRRLAVASALASLCSTWAFAIPAASLPLKSSGEAAGSGGWKMTSNGYVGGYLRVEKSGTVTFRIRVASADSDRPLVGLSVAGELTNLEPTAASTWQPKRDLAAGTYFVRLQTTRAPATIESIDVEGATLLAESTDELALAAADTYIEHGRKRRLSFQLDDVAPGSTVHVKLRRHAFDFGGNISGHDATLVANNPPPGSDPAEFQEFFTNHFNAFVPSNAGKWGYNESKRDTPTMNDIDAILAFGKQHDMHVRMHAMLWDAQQEPKWVGELLKRAKAGDAAAKADLRKAITSRIGYYVRERATQFDELDVLNEVFHQRRYFDVFGESGLADIYAEVASAIEAAGAKTRTYINEYNVLQYSQRPPFGDGSDDRYANWYREHAEHILAAGGKLGGIGVQYYADPRAQTSDPHHAASIAAKLNNLAVAGLPITLTEFGIQKEPDDATRVRIMDESIRLLFGTPEATGFYFFGFWGGAMWNQAPAAVLVDKQWKLTSAGERYEELMRRWTTDLDVVVDANHTVSFVGFAGEYEAISGVKTLRAMAKAETPR